MFLFSLLLILCPVMAAAQEAVKTDTVRAELQSDFLETVGDSTDLIVAGEGSNNWFITLWGGVNSLAAEANRHYDNFLDRSRVSFRLSVGKWFTPVWGFRLQMGVGRLSGHSHLLKYYNMYDHAVDHTVIPSEIADNVFYVNGVDWFERKFTYMDWSVNAMTDVVRWFAKERKRVGLVLAMGPGYVHTFSSQGLSAGNSFAFELARKIGLPEDIVKRAEEKAGNDFVDIERHLKKIARSRRDLDRRLERIRIADKTLESVTGKYQKELEGIRTARKEILEKAREEAEEIFQDWQGGGRR